jgi:hypothetical protein
MQYTSYIGLRERQVQATGVQRLMHAMLEDCLRTLLAGSTSDRSKWQQRDIAWITSDERTDIFAFENVCDALGIDPGYLRSRVLAALLHRQAAGGRA